MNDDQRSAAQAEKVADLELLEERAEISRRTLPAGRVQVRRELERHVETVQVELVREVLVLRLEAGDGPGVVLNGEVLAPGEERRFELYREEAEVVKKVVLSERVEVFKQRVREPRRLEVELKRHRLVVNGEKV
ncbi:uncharacterized protein (TIGR02271 family) [Deinobacterium chartae]|uniref:Uncharacterized protein (TIGR02271 family) n=1 Tax=Deinobacterium chartae TaxID=521158 RepID=A0A841I6B1_9DEIO|nr:uncharacterized protein (TIGR02271 family) [Deinobacterium chartae]